MVRSLSSRSASRLRLLGAIHHIVQAVGRHVPLGGTSVPEEAHVLEALARGVVAVYNHASGEDKEFYAWSQFR